MNDDLTRHLARVALRVSRDLQDAASVLKDHVSAEERRTFSLGIADAIQTVMTNLVDRPLASRPDLRAEIESQIDRYGVYL